MHQADVYLNFDKTICETLVLSVRADSAKKYTLEIVVFSQYDLFANFMDIGRNRIFCFNI